MRWTTLLFMTARSNTTTRSDDALYMTDDLEGRLDEDSLKSPIVEVIDVGPVRSALEVVMDPPLKFHPPPFRSALKVLRDGANVELPEWEDDVTEETISDELPPIKLMATITLATDQEHWNVTAELRTLSFGKGWLCSLEGADNQVVIAMATAFARFKPFAVVTVEVGGERFELSGDLDFTVSFGYGGCSFTVAADEGRYLNE